jgi:hypothetical protein
MSNVFGEINNTPSNRTGQSGVGADFIGRVGSGVLQTIEEGEGAIDTAPFYYTKDTAYFQAPSTQRSHGDDRRNIAIRGFGARGQVTLTRRHYFNGPSYVRLKLPINYAWAGCEYVARSTLTDGRIRMSAAVGVLSNPITTVDVTTNGPPITEVTATLHDPLKTTFPVIDSYFNHSMNRFVEVPGSDTMLPTSFQSQGLAFAAVSQIELDLGGAGKITFDRYANFAAIMASTPFTAVRKDLMRFSGGGLNLWDEREAKEAPVEWGWVQGYNAAGNQDSLVVDESGTNHAVTQVPIKRFVPIGWDIILPVKTPDTNFFYGLKKRKPLDSSCLAGDLMFTFTWSNFYEWSDTGLGYPNAPVYLPQTLVSQGNLATDGSLYRGALTAAVNNKTFSEEQFILPFVPELAATNGGTLYSGVSIAAPFLGVEYNDVYSTVEVKDVTSTYPFMNNVMKRNPRIWTNHYRVASGRKMNIYDTLGDRVRYRTGPHGFTISSTYSGRPRYPQAVQLINSSSTDQILSLQGAADDINNPALIQYPQGWSYAEYVNSYLKLTNPSLGAYDKLRINPSAAIFYPFQYFFTQIYRIDDHPFANILNWNTTTVDVGTTASNRLLTDQNKIQQMIQMPANPCTSMIVGIYREKDRKFLGKNTMNSYSPVLFWNALNPLRATLWDGGNILFNYDSTTDFESYSLVDRPDPLKIPFKGGCVKVSPKGYYVSDSVGLTGGCWDSTCSAVQTDMNPPYSTGRPIWIGSSGGNIAAAPPINLGYKGSGIPVGGAVNSFAADDIISACSLDPLAKRRQPCHLTEEYEATLLEFPFTMNNPICDERFVQSTPSFAKTQLKLEFWISPKLKPDNGLDDHYDRTYGLTRGAASGMPRVGTITPGIGYTYPGACSHPVPDCLRVGSNPEDPDLMRRFDMGNTDPGSGMSTSSNCEAFKYCDGYSFKQASSWNINNGSLLVHITFCQNQVWTISPLRTSVLSARG